MTINEFLQKFKGKTLKDCLQMSQDLERVDIFDVDGNIVESNATAASVFNYADREIEGVQIIPVDAQRGNEKFRLVLTVASMNVSK